jgi:hypothetical protein
MSSESQRVSQERCPAGLKCNKHNLEIHEQQLQYHREMYEVHEITRDIIGPQSSMTTMVYSRICQKNYKVEKEQTWHEDAGFISPSIVSFPEFSSSDSSFSSDDGLLTIPPNKTKLETKKEQIWNKADGFIGPSTGSSSDFDSSDSDSSDSGLDKPKGISAVVHKMRVGHGQHDLDGKISTVEKQTRDNDNDLFNDNKPSLVPRAPSTM